ncbi:MAG: hypothetical protein KKA84_04555 [Bacteroidetes bacterium]|nr:hypothetical protein [Bacteroidota bacterium]
MIKKLLLLAIAFSASRLLAQGYQLNPESYKDLVSRTKCTIGYYDVGTVNNSEYPGLYGNLCYKKSNVNPFDLSGYDIGVGFEGGINFLHQSGFTIGAVIPYAQVGPEIRIDDRFFLGVHIGFSLFAAGKYFAFAAYAGAEVGYIAEIFNSTNVEIIAGFNSPFLTGFTNQIFIPFIGAGIPL